jgi:Ca2+:H+ antiporter
MSRGMAVLLVVSYFAFLIFQLRTHHGIYEAFLVEEEFRDGDRQDSRIHLLTATEVVVALAISIGLIIIISFILDDQISYLVVERQVSEAFVGLFLVPIVEKTAEHLGTISEAYDDKMGGVLSRVLGGTIQTALLNGPLIVMVGWGLDKPMGLDFNLFDIAVLLLAALTVGDFMRCGRSTYLHGVSAIILYIAIGVAALSYPNLGRG